MSDVVDKQTAERTFLHDIATPTAIALGMLDMLSDDVATGIAKLDATQAKRIENALNALLKLQEMMAERRKVLFEERKA